MRIPTRIQEHPIEAAIASLLLLAVLFGSADFKPSPAETPPNSMAQKL
ncbi:MAG: hypothetical protein V4559_12185 [Pseudomonadota bacterium]